VALVTLLLAGLGALVVQPWGASDEAADATLSGAAHLPSAATDGPPSSVPAEPRPAQLLDEAASRLRDLRTTEGMIAWAAVGIPSRSGSSRLLDALPDPPSLGSSCRDGALLGEGSEAIALALPTVEPYSLGAHRLIAGKQARPLRIAVGRDPEARIAVVRPASSSWSAGYYAISFTVDGHRRVLPVCIGQLTRAVDYSLIVYMPREAGTADAPSAVDEERRHK
jgi:hypothetical protein